MLKITLLLSLLTIYPGFLKGSDMGNDTQITHSKSIRSWDENAHSWHTSMEEGSSFQTEIVDQALDKLLPAIKKNTTILEIACGNGFLSRRLAKLGAEVYAFDSSPKMIELAIQSTNSALREHICFQVADATKPETYQQLNTPFDCVICNMALMDISDIASVFHGVSKVLKCNGSFILTQTHPCFEKAVGPIFHETEEGDGTTKHLHGVKVSRYLTPFAISVKALPTLPKEHLFFHRSLSHIIKTAFEAGFVLDGLEEIAFPKNEAISEHNGWHLLQEIPVIMGFRFIKLNKT